MTKITRSLSDTAVIEELYNRLEERRKQQGIKQADMAERVGITPKSYRAIKEGKCKLEVFVALVRQFGLVEQFDDLIPEQRISPLQLASKHSGSRARTLGGVKGARERALTQADLLLKRKPLKTKGE
ncbi:helix-turn-helix transcriptional regulator [Lacimicrobium alkaliphilum]|uniref:HTH cro/C1-type domain-containing protein n=1 Tax=Lacimicrobium alkaliphilum TaxID=1526571 RepID=A0ABQ1R8F2_9ALTE|nr:helix-turn-helix transcriptional regulator [Lacimicrobium alkaliphilum]GGD59727.1 hypothetical protein GCM10011357_13760 [Lacimicrobium alkaliphilum]